MKKITKEAAMIRIGKTRRTNEAETIEILNGAYHSQNDKVNDERREKIKLLWDSKKFFKHKIDENVSVVSGQNGIINCRNQQIKAFCAGEKIKDYINL